MHAQNIIQDLLQTECDSIYAKRRLTLALMVQASCIGTLSLMGLSRRLNATPQDLGAFEYVRSNPVACRLILYKKPACHRQAKTAFGQRARCRHSLGVNVGVNGVTLR